MTEIIYRIGDVTTADLPVTPDGPNVVIAHVVNDVGRWGAGFTAALDRRWCCVRTGYLAWINSRTHELGHVSAQLVAPPSAEYPVAIVGTHLIADVLVAHMCAQHGVRCSNNPVPLVYDALARCLDNLGRYVAACMQASGKPYEVRMPRIGCGLAGGTWDRVEPLVRAAADRHGVQFVVYDLFGAN